MGKPNSFTQAKADEICARLRTGEPLTWICADEHLPAPQTVSDWKKARPEFAQAFAEARQDGFDSIAAACLRIADTPVDGVTEKLEWVETGPAGDTGGPALREMRVTERKREDMLGHRKLQIETRLKLLAKWDPARYGDKVQHADAEGNILPAPQFIIQPVATAAPADTDADDA